MTPKGGQLITTKPSRNLSRRDALKLLGAGAGATVLANLPTKWSTPALTAGVLPAHAQTSETLPEGNLPTVETLEANALDYYWLATLNGDLIADGGSAILDRGFYWSDVNPPTSADNAVSVGPGAFGLFHWDVVHALVAPFTHYYVAYATNAVGTATGAVVSYETGICLAEGTLISLADGSTRRIEEVRSSDWLRVWNFDDARFDSAQPLWIKKTEITDCYNLLEFSDGSSLRTINQHRIFNKEMGMFTYPMTEDTPVGTTTFNIHGREVTLVRKSVVHERVRYYNIITHRHINMFADGILTSCRYNNLYPIVDMQFVKDARAPIPAAAYGVETRFYEGLRLAEQTIPIADTLAYVRRLEAYEAQPELAAA